MQEPTRFPQQTCHKQHSSPGFSKERRACWVALSCSHQKAQVSQCRPHDQLDQELLTSLRAPKWAPDPCLSSGHYPPWQPDQFPLHTLAYSSIEKDQESQGSKYQRHHSVKTSPVTFLREGNVMTSGKLARPSMSRRALSGKTVWNARSCKWLWSFQSQCSTADLRLKLISGKM